MKVDYTSIKNDFNTTKSLLNRIDKRDKNRVSKLVTEPPKDVFEFTSRTIEWLPEDVEKMSSMSQEEAIIYKQYLKANNKYTYKENS